MSFRQSLARVRANIMAFFGGGSPAAADVPARFTGPAVADAAAAGFEVVDATDEGGDVPTPESIPGFMRKPVAERTGPAASPAPDAASAGGADATTGPAPARPVEIAATAPVPADEPAVDAAGAGEKAVVATPDPDAERLLARSALLQGQMLDLSARLADMQHRVRAFEHHQYLALGEVLAECLQLRHEYLRLKAERSGAAADVDDARKAAADADAYRRAAEESAKPLPTLDEDEQDELRKLYRSAAMHCHPDRADEADKASAHGFFIRVQEAYRARDVAALRRIVGELRAGAVRSHEAPTVARGADAIRDRVGELQNQVADLILAVQTLQLDRIYRQAVQIEDWDAFFARARQGFESECETLRAQIRAFAGAAG